MLCGTSVTSAQVDEDGTLQSPETECQSETSSSQNATGYVPSAAGEEPRQVKKALCESF